MATERPWKIEKPEFRKVIHIIDGFYREESDNRKIATLWTEGHDAEVNAAFIVEAVNNYDALKSSNERLGERVKELEAALVEANRADPDFGRRKPHPDRVLGTEDCACGKCSNCEYRRQKADFPGKLNLTSTTVKESSEEAS